MQKRKASWTKPIGFLCLAFLGVGGGESMAQTNSSSEVAYALLSGSQLLDDCPICDHVPIPVPIQGTFRLRLKEANPLFGTYELLDIRFQTAPEAARQYTLTGGGTYEYGGPGGLIQDALFTLTIDDGSKKTLCYCTNLVHSTGTVWPGIQIDVDHTNGTPARVYRLKILAAPIPRFTAVIPQSPPGKVRLEWTSDGQKVQVEKADSVDGPYIALSPITTDQAYTDAVSPAHRTQCYYRLRLW